MVTKAIERAQNTVEQRNAEIRKNVLKYDEVMNEQRKVIYKRRDQILDGRPRAETLDGVPRRGVEAAVATHCVIDIADEEWDLDGLHRPRSPPYWPTDMTVSQLGEAGRHRRPVRPADRRGVAYYEKREAELGEVMREIERQVMLQHHRPALARAPRRDGLPRGRHQPAGHGPARPAHRVAARGLRDVRQMMKGIAQDFVKYVMHVQVVRKEEAPEAGGAERAADVERGSVERGRHLAAAAQGRGIGRRAEMPGGGAIGVRRPAEAEAADRS
jgi:preprotein translocase subunit SecA